jgi:ankyrin repeat protein
LFKGYLTAARASNKAKRTEAMVNIGYCMTHAFGTRYDISEAMVWFGRAGIEGSTIGQAMVFRLERLMKQSATELVLRLDKRTYVNWMMTCLLPNLDFGPAILANTLPPEIHLENLLARLREVLSSFEPELVEKGLQRAVDDHIVRVATFYKKDYSHDPAWEVFPKIWTAITRDDPIPIDDLLTANDPKFSASVKKALILSAAEERAVNILRSLIYHHKLHLEKSFEIALVGAFRRSDIEISCLLIDLGVPGAVMLSSNALNSVITGASSPTIEIALQLGQMVQVEEEELEKEAAEYPPCYLPKVLRRETMDGIVPLMHSYCNREIPRYETIDNFHPPICETVLNNRHNNLWLILSAGGNPNVRCMGMTALHLAVRFLRPLLVGFLLALGADPNARDFRSQYETPLHQISGSKAYPILNKDEYYDFRDIFGDKFTPAPAYPDEDNNSRRLIIRLLLEYGADLNSLCAGGMTPLMSAIVSPEPHASMIAKYLIELGADPLKTGPNGLTAIHVASTQGSLQILRHLLYIPGHALLNQPSSLGVTPLMAACGSAGRERHVMELLEAGADITFRSSDGRNALSEAMWASQKTIFNILIDHVERLPARFRDAVLSVNPVCGVTAACGAFESKDETTVTYFLQKLIPLMNDPHRADNGGLTPLHMAVILKMIPAMKILLENRADVNAKSRYGMTPLHLSYLLREQVSINLLLSWKADRGIRNDFSLTPEEFGFTATRSPGMMEMYIKELESSHGAIESTISHDHDLVRTQRPFCTKYTGFI